MSATKAVTMAVTTATWAENRVEANRAVANTVAESTAVAVASMAAVAESTEAAVVNKGAAAANKGAAMESMAAAMANTAVANSEATVAGNTAVAEKVENTVAPTIASSPHTAR